MCFGAGRSEKLLFFARPMLKIFDAAPLALDEGSVRGFDVCPLVKAREIVCAPIGEKLVDRFGIVFAAKHGGARIEWKGGSFPHATSGADLL